MAISGRVDVPTALALLLLTLSPAVGSEHGETSVVTLDAGSFSDVVSSHPFIVIEFFAPWCGHCQRLEPEYEKAASLLSNHDPPIVLAKIDANDENNKEIAKKHEVRGFPTLKIFRDQGKIIQEYRGPRNADGIVEYLKQQVGPASAEIKSREEAVGLVEEKRLLTVGVFPTYAGREFENFMRFAEKWRADYDFGHTSNAEYLPLGDHTVKGPLVRLFKPFDELFADHTDFDLASLDAFLSIESRPLVVTFDNDTRNHRYAGDYFNAKDVKAMLFVNFTVQDIDSYKSTIRAAAQIFREKKMAFLIGDLDTTANPFKYFGVKKDQVPFVIIQDDEDRKYLKANVKPDEIISWLNDYLEGKLPLFKKSEPIPEVNDEPVKAVVANNIDDMLFKSRKNVLIEFYAPWCGHCKKLAPILEEVAISFERDDDIAILKMDSTANDVPKESLRSTAIQPCITTQVKES